MKWILVEEDNLIHQDDDRQTVVCHMSATVRNPEVMRDAKLICAAPELLDALEDFVRICETGSPLYFIQQIGYSCARARDVIAKAKSS